MATVFFSYVLRDAAPAAGFERQMLDEVAPAALAQVTVESWTLHRNEGWPGASVDGPDYVCVVEVADVERWAQMSSASIGETHGTLAPYLSRIEMSVSVEVVHSAQGPAGRSAAR